MVVSEQKGEDLAREADCCPRVPRGEGWTFLVEDRSVAEKKTENLPSSSIEHPDKRIHSSFQSFSNFGAKWMRMLKFFNVQRFPHFIFFISLIQVVFYHAAGDAVKKVFLFDAENMNEIWRFVTYMLLHADSVHLSLNVLVQGLLGVPLEFEQGPFRCAAIYFGGGLAGSLASSVSAVFSTMVGASGGVYALLTSQIPNVVLNCETIKYPGYRILVVVTLTASDFIYVYCHVRFNNNEKPRIGWVAHASGASAGLLLGFSILDGTAEWKRKPKAIASVTLLISCLLVLAYGLLRSLRASPQVFP